MTQDLQGHVAKKVVHKPHLFFVKKLSMYISYNRERLYCMPHLRFMTKKAFDPAYFLRAMAIVNLQVFFFDLTEVICSPK